MQVAFISQGKLYTVGAGAPGATSSLAPREVISQFAKNANERAIRSNERHGWKARTEDGPEMLPAAMLWRQGMSDATAAQPRIFSVAAAPSRLIYSMQLGAMGGLFEHDQADQSERRLYHRAQFFVRDLARHPTANKIAMSIEQSDRTANLAIAEEDGGRLREITEGDSIDESPAWVPGDRMKLVFQSAGVARNQHGHVIATGAYAIEELDLDSGDMQTLLTDERYDFLSPRVAADGSLLVIRRPYDPSHRRKVSPWQVALDIVCFPYRFIRALIGLFNFVSMVFTKKPLVTSGGPEQEPKKTASMMLWGKMIAAERAMKDSKRDSTGSLVPKDWQLVRIDKSGGETVIAEPVGSFDLCADGSIIHTDGSAIFHRDAAGSSREICKASLIERVIAIE